MLFNSFQFLFFFPIVTIIYFLLPHKYRWIHLLIASCIFYMALIPVYIFILIFTIIIDYYAGIMIGESTGKKRKYFLILSIISNVLVLAVFKYFNFFIENTNVLLHCFNIKNSDLPYLNIILPVGLSFHTFQAMSYTIEVYKKNFQPERHFGYYSLYVMFYPQLVAGPIERPQNILPQLKIPQKFDIKRISKGLRLILWGLFKKVVIAERFGLMSNEVYNHLNQYTGFAYILATMFFAIQIYCDFSAYSDIAIGTARVMGIDLMINFKRPYFATSISDFWRRWHISLSTWFRDYLYIPLGGNRTSKIRRNLNLFIVFLVSGFWHGASWNFVIWGSIHGTYLIVENIIQKTFKISSKVNWLNIIFVFLLVNFAWIFFRANNLNDSLKVISNLFSTIQGKNYFSVVNDDLVGNVLFFGLPKWKFLLTLLLVPVLFLSDWCIENGFISYFDKQKLVVKWSVYYLLVFAILFIGVFEINSFIYFQF